MGAAEFGLSILLLPVLVTRAGLLFADFTLL